MKRQSRERQDRILQFLETYSQENGYPPTVREIGKELGIESTSLVSFYLTQLEKKGYISRDPAISRGIRLTQSDNPRKSHVLQGDTLAIPYLGTIVASEPINAEALPGDETIEINQALFGRDPGSLFALKVQGNSMIDALVHDGDLVILHQQERVENGEMAAVWLMDREETTLKKVYYEEPEVRLQPANPTMKPIRVPANQVLVQGKVVMVIRRLA
ncbi:MAG: transcriptional repressor LexA [Anaerolineae bacterium]|nr:transcriptional repressor LexA [Anaerolineae bacterium]